VSEEFDLRVSDILVAASFPIRFPTLSKNEMKKLKHVTADIK
jgi:hypothetical protein